jgi:pimeloyl-ACP methyl ester carboxylesterase
VRVDIGGGVRLFVDVDGFSLVPTSDWAGLEQRPTIVALHGGPGLDHVGLKASVGALSSIAQVVVYDHRGHGRSDWRTPDEWTLDVWADDVVRVCDALGIEQPIVLGNSFGGFVAQRYLARHPGHASKAILYATGTTMDPVRVAAGFRTVGGDVAGDAALAFWTDPTLEHALRFRETCRIYYSARREISASDALTTRNPEMFSHFARGEGWTMDLRPDCAAVACPVLVLSGDQDPVFDVDATAELVDALPSETTTWVRFAGSSHMIGSDEPERFVEAITDFVLAD